MDKTKLCDLCGKKISYSKARGKWRKYCGEKCIKIAISKNLKERAKSLSPCKTDDCHNKASRVGAGLCEACYGRQRRRGTTDIKTYPDKTITSAGYVRIKEPNHCLSDSTGSVYEHRFVYFEGNGKGPFLCYWCGESVSWDTMHVDHLDDIKKNNEPDNLVASCPECNQARGRNKMKMSMRRKHGITHNGRTMTRSEWAVEIGISRSTLNYRLANWGHTAKTFTTPKGTTGCHDIKTATEDGGFGRDNRAADTKA